jgi:hypothetical protein
MTTLPSIEEFQLAQVAAEFRAAQDRSEQEHHLFDAPLVSEVVRLAEKSKRHTRLAGWMGQAEARGRIEQWKEKVRAQATLSTNPNAGKVVLSLFDHTGNWSRPWEEAGYNVLRFDIQDNPETGDVNFFDVEFFSDYFGDFYGLEVYAILAACPCTEFANSGARHFAAKDADGRTVAAIELVRQTLRTIEYYRPVVWAIENPVGRIEKLGDLPPWRLAFNPNDLGDPYTKKTLIWGRFNADLPIAPVEPVEGSKMHIKFGGKSLATKNGRSETPEGFAYGFFLANNAYDNPGLALCWKYDRLDTRLLRLALDAGISTQQLGQLIDDDYYDMNDEAAEQSLRGLVATHSTDSAPNVFDTSGVLDMYQSGALRVALSYRILALCFGSGVDSTAMIVALRAANLRPDVITFADTGAEKPETLRHIDAMNCVLTAWGWPLIDVCQKVPLATTGYTDLYGNCMKNETLPSLAFGLKSCSIKWKHNPQDQFLKGVSRGPNARPPHPIWLRAQSTRQRIVKLIGYDCGKADMRRSKAPKPADDDFDYVYPLQIVGWARPDCVRAISQALGDHLVPIKSACFFCPASKQWELYWLAANHPEMLERALLLERNALTGKHSRFDAVAFGATWEELVRDAASFPSTSTTVGLGRSFAWNQWARVNEVVDEVFTVKRDPASRERFAMLSNSLRDPDNALDSRTPRIEFEVIESGR